MWKIKDQILMLHKPVSGPEVVNFLYEVEKL